jgi:hypothetical protein
MYTISYVQVHSGKILPDTKHKFFFRPESIVHTRQRDGALRWIYQNEMWTLFLNANTVLKTTIAYKKGPLPPCLPLELILMPMNDHLATLCRVK